MVLLNSHKEFPYHHFKTECGYSLAQYKDFIDERNYLVAKWEEFVGPIRKSYNQKMEIVNKTSAGHPQNKNKFIR